MKDYSPEERANNSYTVTRFVNIFNIFFEKISVKKILL